MEGETQMSKFARIMRGGTYGNGSDLDPIKELYGEKLKGVTICIGDSEDRRGVACVDYSIYYTDNHWEDNIPAGGIKLIDEQQNGSGMANQGGTDWKEGADPSEALRIVSRIFDELSQVENIEIVQKHPYP